MAACVFRGLDEVHEDLQRMHSLYGNRASRDGRTILVSRTGTAYGLGIRSMCSAAKHWYSAVLVKYWHGPVRRLRLPSE